MLPAIVEKSLKVMHVIGKRPLLFAFFGPLAIAAVIASADEYSAEERAHWSLQPRGRAAVPSFDEASERDWVSTPVDAFVLSKLKQRDLQPAGEADRATLIRRVTFGLTGLPPTPEEIAEFTSDTSPDAYERLVDRLLASPRYGEHWGQHWLDVVRYAESEGFEYDRHRPGAWRYRDYVIGALNDDKPYDRFVLEQLAGDEMVSLPLSTPEDAQRGALIAAGFHRLAPVRRNAGNTDVAFSRNEVLTEMTDIIGTALLGVTLGCARCHDHMFDPIRQKDYYRMQAFLAATHEYDISLAPQSEQRTWQTRLDKVNAEIQKVKEALEQSDAATRTKLEQQLKDLEYQLPPPLETISSVHNVDAQRTPIHVLSRGDTGKPGDAVGMRVLGVLLPDGSAELPADATQPKTKLAEWLLQGDHPLTARVIVNRIWQYHFGSGLVRTPNDFGVNGDSPSHPELLDFLANELIDGGWRLKRIHRMILLSSTYRQSSRGQDESAAIEFDPGNRLLWRFPRRRLQAQEIRDAMLMISGRLNSRAVGPSVMVPVEQDLVNLLYKPSQWEVTSDPAEHHRRSVYLIAKRNLRLPFMEVFDQPDFQTSCARRESSTHAPQGLELLNGELANELAEALAQRLIDEAGPDANRQVELAFLLAAGRSPTDRERRLALRFLSQQPLQEFALAMFNLNSFLYVD
jgi:hypothetical protein